MIDAHNVAERIHATFLSSTCYLEVTVTRNTGGQDKLSGTATKLLESKSDLVKDLQEARADSGLVLH